MKKIFCLALLISRLLFADGQTIQGPLRIGDSVPDIIFNKTANYKSSSIRLSEFRGQTLILDFWSTNCSFCIELFPKLKRLQEKYKDKITILPVGVDGNIRGSIRRFLEENRGTKRELQLPSVILGADDTLLARLFPYKGLPHLVWIDPSGHLIGLTHHKALTEKNLTMVSNGQRPEFVVKKMAKEIWSKDVFLINSKQYAPVYGSAFAGYIDTIRTILSFGHQTDSSILKFFIVNRTLPHFYTSVYSKLFPEFKTGSMKRILFDSACARYFTDREKRRQYDNIKYEEYKRNNFFCYDLILPRSYSLPDAYRYMIADFDRYFQVKSRMERRKIKCLALKKTSPMSKIHVLPGNSKFSAQTRGDSVLYMGINMQQLTEDLDTKSFTSLVIINETGIKAPIDIVLPGELPTLEEVNKCLRKYNLMLTEVKRKLDVLMLSSGVR